MIGRIFLKGSRIAPVGTRMRDRQPFPEGGFAPAVPGVVSCRGAPNRGRVWPRAAAGDGKSRYLGVPVNHAIGITRRNCNPLIDLIHRRTVRGLILAILPA